MNIIAVDDERIALDRLCDCIEEAEPKAFLRSFSSPRQALAYADIHSVDVAFLDIDMRGMNGIELASAMKKHHPDINIIFVTGYNEYSMEAFSLHASGYVMKPFLAKDIKAELSQLRFPVSEVSSSRGINVTCFGNFSVHRDGMPIDFQYEKTKELFAYLVYRRGMLCSDEELMKVLGVNFDYYQKLRVDFVKNIPSEILYHKRKSIGIRIEQLVCDYYDYLKGKLSAINSYSGEFMLQYQWVDLRTANLHR